MAKEMMLRAVRSALPLGVLLSGCFVLGAPGGGGGGGGGAVSGGGSVSAGGSVQVSAPASLRGGSAPTLQGPCGAGFGSTASAQRLSAFLQGASVFVNTAASLQGDLEQSCAAMARDLNVPEAELAPQGNQLRVQSACERVARALREELAALRSTPNVQVVAEQVPPVCTTNVRQFEECLQRCDTSYTPGRVELQCEGGELRGQCSAQCSGSCAVEVHGSCAGSCEGQCQGQWQGASCQGQCDGYCNLGAQASCQGECRGGCSVRYTEPSCSGRVVPPQVQTTCRTSCETRSVSESVCTPGYTRFRVTGVESLAEAAARAQRVRAAVTGGLGVIAGLGRKLELLVASGRALAENATAVPQAVGELGLGAGLCATQAVTALPGAVASVGVSLQVSVSVSGSLQAR